MKPIKFPTTKHELSKLSKVPIDANFIINNLKNSGIDPALFLNYYRPLFSELLNENYYGVRFFLKKRSNKLLLSQYFEPANSDDEESASFPPFPKNCTEAPEPFFANHLLGTLLIRIYESLTKNSKIGDAQLSVFFRRLQPQQTIENLNFSFLMIDRKNIDGGLSVIKDPKGKALIQHVFLPGEYIFYSKNETTEDSKNGLTHFFFPIDIADFSKNESWIDVITFEMDFLQS